MAASTVERAAANAFALVRGGDITLSLDVVLARFL